MDEVQRLKDQITHLEHKVWLLEDALGRASDNPHWCTQCREFVVYKPGGSTRPTPSVK